MIKIIQLIKNFLNILKICCPDFPVIAGNFSRITSYNVCYTKLLRVVQHQERKYGITKFGFERFLRGPLDLLSVIFIAKFSKRPMHFFGLLGTLVFMAGFIAAAWVGIDKLIAISQQIAAPKVTESPYFYLALTAMIIGSQLFLAGFIGELVSRNASERNKYLIEKKIS